MTPYQRYYQLRLARLARLAYAQRRFRRPHFGAEPLNLALRYPLSTLDPTRAAPDAAILRVAPERIAPEGVPSALDAARGISSAIGRTLFQQIQEALLSAKPLQTIANLIQRFRVANPLPRDIPLGTPIQQWYSALGTNDVLRPGEIYRWPNKPRRIHVTPGFIGLGYAGANQPFVLYTPEQWEWGYM